MKKSIKKVYLFGGLKIRFNRKGREEKGELGVNLIILDRDNGRVITELFLTNNEFCNALSQNTYFTNCDIVTYNYED